MVPCLYAYLPEANPCSPSFCRDERSKNDLPFLLALLAPNHAPISGPAVQAPLWRKKQRSKHKNYKSDSTPFVFLNLQLSFVAKADEESKGMKERKELLCEESTGVVSGVERCFFSALSVFLAWLGFFPMWCSVLPIFAYAGQRLKRKRSRQRGNAKRGAWR